MMNTELYDLTNPQKSIWLTEQFYKGTSVNNVCGTVLIDEIIDFDHLLTAINIFIRDNDSFRIHIKIDKNGNVKQYFKDFEERTFVKHNLNDYNELHVLEHNIANTPFTIVESDLYNIELFSFSDGKGGFVVNASHLVADACTASLVASKIMNIYSSLIKGEQITEPATSYVNYINSEKEYLASPKFEKDKEYWENNFISLPDMASLSDNIIKADSCCDCSSNRKVFVLSQAEMENISDYCKFHHFSLFNFFMAVFAVYIGKVKNLKKFVLGTPILNRTTFEEKHTPGMFISTVPFYFDIGNNLTFIDFVSSIANQSIGMFRHQKYPYQEILSYLRKRDSSIPNLYNIMISYQNTKIDRDSSNINYDVTWTHSDYTSDEIDIHIFDMNGCGNLNIAYDYQLSKYSENDIDNLHNRVLNIIKQVIDSDDSLTINNLSLVTKDEASEMLKNYSFLNEIEIKHTVVDLFLSQVETVPNSIAISNGNLSLTYKELNDAANSLCALFINSGITPKDKICLFLNNSIELIITILATLKCGACYIPIDVNFPLGRIEYIVHNSECKHIVTNSENIHKLDFLANMCILADYNMIANLPRTNINYNYSTLSNLAYIIYTSGSTGNPKGVKIANESLSNYISWANKVYVHGQLCNFPLYSSIAFDLTVTSIFTPLISGNSIYIYNNNNPQLLLKQIIDDRNVQIIKLTPAHLTLLLDCLTPDTTVTKLIVGGDILSSEICRKITDATDHDISIYNEYGPTEATVGCMIHKYQKNDNIYSSVPIGIPADNVKLYVLNDDLNLLPYDQKGELYISGKCLSRGYVKLATKTAERFIPSPFSVKDKLYKTGDIVVLHKNLVMEYVGRSDFQVKINGYRIETGEIQSKILAYPNIKDCFVTTFEKSSNKNLCAYYVCDKDKPIVLKDLKAYLLNFLPSYMIPKYFVALDHMPLTTNGKIRKDQLPIPTKSGYDVFTPPKNKTEKILSDTFCKLLNLDKMSVTANIFDYYVDSLVLIKAQTLLYSNGINVNTQKFYEFPSIRSLANYIEKNNVDTVSSYTNYNKILNINDFKQKNDCPNLDYNNILLFGVTGFLGIHILYSLLLNTSAHIYCVIREKDNLNPVQRFFNKFIFYFSKEEFDKYISRITTITGDVRKETFSISNEEYNKLGKIVDCVIDTAAIVKHYGNYEDFYNTNVLGTKKIVDFCVTFNIPLHYISTMTVSGYGLVKTPKCEFTENDFYIGQNYRDNIYVESKFEAEALIFEACKKNNLRASIYRLGNITNRYSDGFFQENAEDNAFFNRMISIINLRKVPKEVLNIGLEFTPVDYCAEFIVKLLKETPDNINIYHLFNSASVKLKDLLKIMEKHGIHIDITPISVFEKFVLSAPDKYFGITNYLSNIKNVSFNQVTLSNQITNNTLKRLGLAWPDLDEAYFSKILNYLIKNNFTN